MIMTSAQHRHLCALAAAAALLATAGVVQAQEDAKAAAQKKMTDGAALLEQGQPGDALRLFKDAYLQVT
jgi:hypothetical protein